MKTPVVLLLLAAVSRGADPSATHTDVFRSGEEGYRSYRIPAIVAAADGSLLAFAEGRKENQGDPGDGDIDLVLKRSADRGATWSPLVVLDDPGEKWSASNPTPVVDRASGRIYIAYNRWRPGMGTYKSRPGTDDNQAWLRWSDDHGRHWSAARDITREARDFGAWGAMFFGPGGAIQTKNGRLLLPAAMCPDTCSAMGAAGAWRGSLSLMRAYAVWSDDHGATWKRGALLPALTDENQLVELADGAVMMDARQASGERRWVGISRDGGATWSRPVAGQAVTPVATAIERLTTKAAGSDRDRLVWTGVSGPGRKNLVVRVSYDEGQTWVNERTIAAGLAAYSDLTTMADGTVGVLWERGVSALSQFITFTRVGRDFLETPASGPVVRESIEWLDVWIPNTNDRALPRVLLIGDSITRGYGKQVELNLKDKTYVARLATSKSLGDPALLDQVTLVLREHTFDIIHFNNGMHGSGYSEEAYAAALPQALELLRKEAPRAKVIWCTTTDVRERDHLERVMPKTERMARRNQLVVDFAKREGLPVNDLFAVVRDHPELHAADGVHFNEKGSAALAAEVAAAIAKLLPLPQ
ncbi:MAG: exo-alpha-sialidase [Bryobacterales bacterium]|nr:exo-alpha-sialidase [Bryobacterales bacterium]